MGLFLVEQVIYNVVLADGRFGLRAGAQRFGADEEDFHLRSTVAFLLRIVRVHGGKLFTQRDQRLQSPPAWHFRRQ